MISLEEFIVGLIFLVPGFISAEAERTFQPRRFDSAYDWTTSSLLRSIGLNIAGLAAVALLGLAGILPQNIPELKMSTINPFLQDLHLGTALIYILALYLASALWGALLGIYPQVTLRELANSWNLTTMGRHDSVWARIKDKQRPPERPHTWIKVHLDNDKMLFGRLRHASSTVEQDKPIELFLKPVYEMESGELSPLTTKGVEADGIYLKLGEAHRVEFYFSAEKEPDAFQPMDSPS